jgi:GntR family transcriptional regulator, transcriptional repressor for pyruvate dehydrogenase complex
MPVKLNNSILSLGRLSDRVKVVLKQAIVDGDLKPGDKLPTEEKIAGGLSVSKVTVREALREMETEGLIEKRRGVHGGSFVTEPSCDKISDLVINYIQFGGVTPEQVAEFRLLLEPSVIALAAERRTEEDLVAIRKCIDSFEKSLATGNVDHVPGIEFHQLIADACYNPLISAVMAAIINVFIEIIATVPISLEDGRIDLNFCKRFYECLLHGDKETARKLMIDHFDTLLEIINRASTKNDREK